MGNELTWIWLIVASCDAVFLITLYILLLIKTIKGSNLKPVLVIIILLLVAQIGSLINAAGTYELFIKEKWTYFNIVLLSVGEAILDGCFSLAHWIFAAQYYKIGTEMPYVVAGRDIPLSTQTSQQRVFNILMVLNILFPVFEIVVLIPFNIKLRTGDSVNLFWELAPSIVPVMPGMM